MEQEQKESAVFPEATEKLLHHFAYGCYNQGQYEKAVKSFRLLVMFRPQNGTYWYSLGSSLMLTGNDEEACHAFKIANTHSPEDPYTLAYWAECSARLGNQAFAKRLIAQAEEKAKNSKYFAFQEQIEVIKERVIEVNHG
jgi:predicted Zn-dependent protease